MGYGFYTLPDGREAGYLVAAECDAKDCTAQIDRGLGYLCGEDPDGHRDPDEPGCGKYFCPAHDATHDCPAPECGAEDKTGDYQCTARRGHEEPHYDYISDAEFTGALEPNA